MNKEDRLSIKSNLNILANKTEHLDALLDILHEKQLVSAAESELLKSLPTKPKRCSDLYLLLLRKGPDAFELLHEALLASGNHEVAEILKPETPAETPQPTGTMTKRDANSSSSHNKFRKISKKNSSSDFYASRPSVIVRNQAVVNKPQATTVIQRPPIQVEVDVEVKEEHITDIVNVLDCYISHAEWPLIVLDLLVEADLREELDRLPSTTPYEVIFEKTLQLWIGSQGQNAKLNFLLNVLISRKQDETADALVKQHKKIFRLPSLS